MTAYGISNMPTDNPLETPSELPKGSSTDGVTDSVLGGAPKSVLVDGFERAEQVIGAYRGDGTPVTQEFATPGDADPAIRGGEATNGFLGRTGLMQER
jgi:hypothetical protein